MGEFRKLFVRNFERLLQKKNISNQQLAETLGVSEVTLSRWRSGVSFPSEENIEALAKYFEVELREFWKPARKGEK